MEKYNPISCNLYDELSNAVVLHKYAYITMTDGSNIEGKITDIYTKDKEEYCTINDLHLRLDLISTLSYYDGDDLIQTQWSNRTNL